MNGVSIIIPAYNAEQTMAECLHAVTNLRWSGDLEVIVVNDGSEDGTGKIAHSNGTIVVSHEKNLGKGAAMKTGVQNARGDIIIFLDGDGAHDPQDMPRVLAPILTREADLVIGSRALPESRVSVSPLTRRLSNNLASFVISVIISFLLPLATLFKWPAKYIKITDCTSGFRAIKRERWQKLHLVSSRFEIETEMIYEAAKDKLVIKEVPISCNWNSQLSRLSILKDGLRTLKLLAGKLIGDIGGR